MVSKTFYPSPRHQAYSDSAQALYEHSSCIGHGGLRLLHGLSPYGRQAPSGEESDLLWFTDKDDSPQLSQGKVKDLIIRSYVGYEAVVRFDPHYDASDEASTGSHDFSLPEAYLRLLVRHSNRALESTRAQLRIAAHDHVRYLWPEIDAVAKALLRRGALSGHEIDLIAAIGRGSDAKGSRKVLKALRGSEAHRSWWEFTAFHT